MLIHKLQDMIGGWYIGDFMPSVMRTSAFEICHKVHKKGEIWPRHYHAQATEINLLISGSMSINGTLLSAGDIFTISPNEIASPIFYEDCVLTVVKTPSIVNDKFEV